MTARVVVVGSANVDVTVRTARLPVSGETVLGREGWVSCGGKGLNQAVTAARLGADVAFVGAVGRDDHGERLLTLLRDEGVDTGAVTVRDDAATGAAYITVDDSGGNTIVVVPGANARVSPADIASARDVIAAADVLLAQLEVPVDATSAAAGLARRSILNPAPAVALPRGFDLIVPNDTEAAALGLPAAAGGWGADVVVTLGAQGALWVEPDGTTHDVAPAKAPGIVDSTGAGDAFCGALAVALAEGRSMADALAFASAAGAWAVSIAGAVPSLPRRSDLDTPLDART